MFFESISRFIYVWLIWVKRVVCGVEVWVDNCGGCAWCYAFSTFLIHFDTSVVKNFENPLNNRRSLPRTVHLDFFLHWYLRPQPQPFPLRTNSIPPIPTILVIPLISMQKSLHYHYHYYYYNYPYSSSYHIYHR
jgi:hypothetical protein